MMFGSKRVGKGRRLILGWLGLVALSWLSVSGVQANEGIVVYDNPDVTGYHVTVLGRPNPISVGKVSLLIRVGRATTTGGEAPVTGMRVLVQFYHVSGPGADKSESYLQRRDLVATASEPGMYEVADSIQNEGVYRITLNMEDGPQKFQTSFDITARPQPDDRFFSLLILALAPILLAWLVWLYLRRPGPPRPTQAEAETEQSDSSTSQAQKVSR